MPIGDHLIVCHDFYIHHGIDLGDGTVLHYGRGLHDLENAKVEIVPMAKFSGGKKVEIIKSVRTFSNAQVVERARSRLGEKCYDVFDNNCEHFVNWCRSGRALSTQISATKTILRQSAAIASRTFLRKGLKGTIARRGAGAPLIIADLIQAGVELMALNSGKGEEESEKLGSQAGAASSMGIGFCAGGPVGAASGLGIWAAGQIFGRAAVKSGEKIIKDSITSNPDDDPDANTIDGSAKS